MRTALLTAAFLLTGCNQLLYVEGQVEQLCQRRADVELTPPSMEDISLLPPDVQAQILEAAKHQKLEKSFDFTLPADLPFAQEGFSAEVGLSTVEFTALRGLDDFGFVQKAHLELHSPEGLELPTVTLLEYERGQDLHPKRVLLTGEKLDVMEYLNNGQLKLGMIFEGEVPSAPVNFDFTACADIKARFEYANAGK